MNDVGQNPILQNFVLCMNSSHDSIRGLCAENILAYLNPEFIPGQFSFCIVGTITNIDINKNYKLNIIMTHKEDGYEAVKLNSDIHFPSAPNNNVPSKYHGANIAIDCKNVKLIKSGEYVLKIVLDNEILKESIIYVKGKNENG